MKRKMKLALFSLGMITLLLSGCSGSTHVEPSSGDDVQSTRALVTETPMAAPTDTETPVPTAPPMQVISPENVDSIVEIRTLTGHGCSVFSLTFSPDSQMLASTSCDQTLRLWDLASGLSRTIGQPGVEFATAFSPDGTMLAAWSNDKTIILYDVASGSILQTFEHTGQLWGAAISPDGKTLASGGEDGTIRLWDLTSGSELPSMSTNLGMRNDIQLYVYSVAFSPDGTMLVSTDQDEIIRLWDLASGGVVRSIEVQDAFSAVFSSDGSILVVETVRSYNNASDAEYIVKLYDVASGSRLRNLSGDPDKGSDRALSPNGRILVVSVGTYNYANPATDRAIVLFDAASGSELLRMTGHTDLVSAVAISPDGRFIASGSADGDRTIKLWGIYP